ncbi:MAG: hypothetical protein OT477_17240 [Chloroflexi bacterium]|nr:hypothetical protein [Chloroflexota bacterium]
MLSDELDNSTPNDIEEYATAPKEKVAILGLKKSGKSTFLTVLQLALALQESPWQFTPRGNTKIIMHELTERLISQGLYPISTPEGEDPHPMKFRAEREARFLGLQEGDWFDVQAHDVPGAWVKGISGGNYDFYEKYVKDCRAIIFLIDPQESWIEEGEVEPGRSPYFTVFNNILNELNEHSSNKVYVAFCITKLDQEQDTPALFAEEGSCDENYLEEKATKILRKATKARIDHFFKHDRCRWFGISATGYYKDENNIMRSQLMERTDEKGQKVAGIARPDELEPIGVAEAVEWVFNSIANIHIGTRTRNENSLKTKFGKWLGL